jgi:hypothetical protein
MEVMASTRRNSTDEEFDVFISSFTDDDEDDDTCSNETEDDDVRLPTEHRIQESASSTVTPRSLSAGQQNTNHVSSSVNTTKFSIASILGTEGDGQNLTEFESKRGQEEGGTFVRPTPVSAVMAPPPLNMALCPSAIFTHQASYTNSTGIMLEMISPTSVSCGSEHPNPSLPYPASLASASAASLLYGGWFSASTANKAPSQLFGLQGKFGCRVGHADEVEPYFTGSTANCVVIVSSLKNSV